MQSEQKTLTEEEKNQAIYWYAVKGFSLQTIADHFKMTVPELSAAMRNV